MRYGYCANFSTPIKDAIDYHLLEDIAAAGYDYVEFPLMLLAALSTEQFSTLRAVLHDSPLTSDAACNMFPAGVRLTGPDADLGVVRGYLAGALDRLHQLGAKTLVFGSAPARNTPDGTSRARGTEQVIHVLDQVVLPMIRGTDLCIAMEAISSNADNLINTLDDAMAIVNAVGDPQVMLLADTVHMLFECEPPEHLRQYRDVLRHIHVCEHDRMLPVHGYTPELARLLAALRAIGYDGTISFEPNVYGREDMASALALLKRQFA